MYSLCNRTACLYSVNWLGRGLLNDLWMLTKYFIRPGWCWEVLRAFADADSINGLNEDKCVTQNCNTGWSKNLRSRVQESHNWKNSFYHLNCIKCFVCFVYFYWQMFWPVQFGTKVYSQFIQTKGRFYLLVVYVDFNLGGYIFCK